MRSQRVGHKKMTNNFTFHIKRNLFELSVIFFIIQAFQVSLGYGIKVKTLSFQGNAKLFTIRTFFTYLLLQTPLNMIKELLWVYLIVHFTQFYLRIFGFKAYHYFCTKYQWL